MVRKLLFIWGIVFGIVATAQIPQKNLTVDSSVFPKEIVAFTVNSDVLLAGELLQYKAYILTADYKTSQLSKVVYMSLRSERDSIVFSHKLKIEDGTAHADFFIPSSLPTGVYRLIGYTQFSKNNERDAYFIEPFYIINTFIKSEKTQNVGDTININFSSTKIEETSLAAKIQLLTIVPNKNTYGHREKVELNIDGPESYLDGNYSVSVRKLEPLEIPKSVLSKSYHSSSNTFYIPEIRGEIISGTILNNSGKPLMNKEVSLTIPGNDFIFKIARTNVNGRFFFSVDETYESERGIVQIISPDSIEQPFNFVMDSKDFKLGPVDSKFMKLDPNLKNWLQERSIQVQVENAYFDIKQDSILENQLNLPFYKNLGTVFLLDNYTRFPTVRETFIEVINLAAIRGSGEDIKFSINNPYNPDGLAKFNEILPLVLVDGIQIQNNQDIVNYNARDIKSIRVITEPYRYGPKIFSGIISVETKDGNFVPTHGNYQSEIVLSPAQKDKLLYHVNYSKPETLSRIPDYRVQLLWKTNVKPDQKKSIEFYTSDVSGTYEIVMKGYTFDGKYVVSKNYFKVGMN